jgi:glycosyltransferase involved in cell wall biosynthesis
MFYLPGVLKGLDSFWLRNCLLTELRHLRCGRPIDLIDAHFEYPEGVGAVRAARALGLPIFVTLRGLLTKYLQSPSRRFQCLRALRDATGIISVAHSLRRTAEAHGIDGSKIRVIPNAIDARTFAPGPQTEARTALGINPAGSLIVTVGHVQPIKGQHDLISALARVRARRGPVRLAIIGNDRFDPKYTRLVRQRIAEGGLGTEVSLLGQQSPERIAMWLRAADLFVLPTYHEGCCNAILEALACGTPIVSTLVGDNADYVDTARGHLVPIGDVAALAAAIATALDQAWDRPAIAAPIAARTWDHVAEEILDFFRERLEACTLAAVRS